MTYAVLSSLTWNVMAKVRKESNRQLTFTACAAHTEWLKESEKKTSTDCIYICAFPTNNKCHLELLQILKEMTFSELLCRLRLT
jgi:hypothetical protein